MLDGQDEPAGEADVVQRPQQGRGAEVVVGDVVADVAEVDTEPDLAPPGGTPRRPRRPRRAQGGGGVVQVGPAAVGAGAEPVGHAVVGGRVQGVEGDDVVAAGDEWRTMWRR